MSTLHEWLGMLFTAALCGVLVWQVAMLRRGDAEDRERRRIIRHMTDRLFGGRP